MHEKMLRHLRYVHTPRCSSCSRKTAPLPFFYPSTSRSIHNACTSSSGASNLLISCYSWRGLSTLWSLGVGDSHLAVSKRSITNTRVFYRICTRTFRHHTDGDGERKRKTRGSQRYLNKNQFDYLYKKGKEMQVRIMRRCLKAKTTARGKLGGSNDVVVKEKLKLLTSSDDLFESVLALGRELNTFYVEEHKKRRSVSGASPSSFALVSNESGAAQTLGSACHGMGKVESSSSNLPTQECIAERVLTTKFEYRQAALLATVQQLLDYCSRDASRAIFLTYQDEVANALMFLPSSLLPTSFASFSDSSLEALRQSLAQRGAKIYVELLCHHHLPPSDKNQWCALCDFLIDGKHCTDVILVVSPGTEDSSNMAYLPLLPSSFLLLKRRYTIPGRERGWGERESSVSLVLSHSCLSRLLTATEAVALIRWCRQFTPEKHISSTDIEAALRKWIQAQPSLRSFLSCSSFSSLSLSPIPEGTFKAHLDSINLDNTIRELLYLWENAKREEGEKPSLAKQCGVSYTHHTSLQIEGSTLVTFPRTSLAVGSGNVDTVHLFPTSNCKVCDLESPRKETEEKQLGKVKMVKKSCPLSCLNSSASSWQYGSTKGYNEALIMGRWQWVLHNILRRLRGHARCEGKVYEEKSARVEAGKSTRKESTHSYPNEKMFFQLSLLELADEVGKFLESDFPHAHALLPQKILAHSWEIPRLPKEVRLFTPLTKEEEVLLLSPPTRGLVLSDTSNYSLQKNKGGQDVTGSQPAPLDVQEIRHRLWTMKHLPSYLPFTLIRFENIIPPSSSSSSSPLSHPSSYVAESSSPSFHNGSVSLPVLDRSPSRELLGWMMVSVFNLSLSLALSSAVKKKTGGNNTFHCISSNASSTPKWEILLRQMRTSIQSLLFSPPHPCYIALNEFSIQLFTRLSYTSGACFYSSVVHPSSVHLGEEIITEVLEKSLHYFFEPPESSFYTMCEERRSEENHNTNLSKHYFSKEAVHLWKEGLRCIKGGETSLSLSPAFSMSKSSHSFFSSGMDMKLSFVSPHWMNYLEKKISCLRNFHFSLYVEALGPLCSGASILEIIKKETLKYGSPVFAPESAAAIVTAMVIYFTSLFSHREDCSERRRSNVKEKKRQEVGEEKMSHKQCCNDVESILSSLEKSGCRYLFLSFPSDKFHPVSSYFKGIFHPSFFTLLQKEKSTRNIAGQKCQLANLDALSTPVEDSAPCEAEISACGEESYIPETGWFGSEALLNGRSLRICDSYPTSTTERFFKLRQAHLEVNEANERNSGKGWFTSPGHSAPKPKVSTVPTISLTYSPPPLRIQFCMVDIYEAVKYFAQKASIDGSHGQNIMSEHSFTSTRSKEEKSKKKVDDEEEDTVALATETPYVIASNLPYGLSAVYKPAGVNCTLHAHYPSLIPFLQKHLPWGKGACGDVERCVAKEQFSAPVLHQHGLINRIDVGTSGVVLVSTTKSSLMNSISASSVFRNVRKFYQALVRAPPPLSSTTSFSNFIPLWHLPPEGTITSHVFANGADVSLNSFRLSTLHSRSTGARLPVALLDQRQAITHFKVLNYYPEHNVYYVEVSLVSGRRHQIRQHFASLGFPLLGDDRYGLGGGKRDLERRGLLSSWKKRLPVKDSFGLRRPALHASRVEITDTSLIPLNPSPSIGDPCESMKCNFPTTRGSKAQKVVVECPLPLDMQRALFFLCKREKRHGENKQ